MYKINAIAILRNLRKRKLVSILNVAGLAIGLSSCLVIYQYVDFESSYDSFHFDASRTYRVVRTEFKNDERTGAQVTTPFALAREAKIEIPEIQAFVRVHPQYLGAVVTNPDNNQPFKEESMLFVDSTFLKVFNFPMKLGDAGTALKGTHNIVLSEAQADNYFGKDADPIGKTLRIADGWVNGDFIVTGILKKSAANTHLVFDFLMPMQGLLQSDEYNKGNGWGRNNFTTYFVVAENSDVAVIENKLNQVVDKALGKILTKWNIKLEMAMQKVTDIHLRSDYITEPNSNNGSARDVQVFSIVAVFILIIAWVNFINLSTARSLERFKEVGIKKTIGASRPQLIFQFLMESVVINFIAACIGIGVAVLMLPLVNDLTGKEMTFMIFARPNFWLGFAGVVLFGALASGFYPAFVLSSFNPVRSLTSGKGSGAFGFRKVLIVVQFAIAAFLVSATVLVYEQVDFMKNQNLGVDMHQILVVQGPSIIADGPNLPSNLKVFKDKVLTHSSVTTAAGSGTVPGKGTSWLALVRKFGDPAKSNVGGGITYGDFDFFTTYNFEFLAGRPFGINHASDNSGTVINEEAVKALGFESPEKAIHEKIVIEGGDTVTVLGVLKNYNWNSLHDAYTPYIFLPAERAHRYLSFTINLSNVRETLDHIKASYNDVFPDNPFDYFFLDEEFNRQYKSDLQFGKLFTIFSVLAIAVACIGLFALVSFSASLKVKEIGIRKILGAQAQSIVIMLSRQYIILISIANLIAIPAVIYAGRSWLNNFPFRIGIGPEVYILPGLLSLMVALLTVSYKFYEMAKTNPVDAVRTE